jgi:hypothetical protein
MHNLIVFVSLGYLINHSYLLLASLAAIQLYGFEMLALLDVVFGTN